MNEETRKMTPEKVNIDNCELDDEELSQAAGGLAGDTCVTWCKKCNGATSHTYLANCGLRCDVCGTERPEKTPYSGGLMMIGK